MDKPISLWTFQHKDQACSIRVPTAHLELTFCERSKMYWSLWLPEFLAKYGSQIQRLSVSSLQIPMEEMEMDFFAKLPKLKGLTVGDFSGGEDYYVKTPLPSGSNTFPSIFKELERLNILRNMATGENSQIFWRLLEQCTNLHTITWFPQSSERFRKLCQLLERGMHKKLKYCCVKALFIIINSLGRPANILCIPELCAMSTNNKLKLLNVSADYLREFKRPQRRDNAPHVSSVIWNFREPFEFFGRASLPNEKKSKCPLM